MVKSPLSARGRVLPPDPYDGLSYSELSERIKLGGAPRPAPGAPLNDLVVWLRRRIDHLVNLAHMPRVSQSLVRFTAMGLNQEWDLDDLMDELASTEARLADELASTEARLAHRAEAEQAALEAAERSKALERKRREWQRERLEVLWGRLESASDGGALTPAVIQEAVAAAGPPEGIPLVSLPAPETAIIALTARLIAVRDVGFGLHARIEGVQSGSYQGGTSSVGFRTRHWSVGSGWSSGSTRSQFSAGIEGALQRREGVVGLDEGLLVVTQQRFLFIGGRESHDIPLRNVLGLSVHGDRLAPHTPEFKRGEAFDVEDADLAGPILAALIAAAVQSGGAPSRVVLTGEHLPAIPGSPTDSASTAPTSAASAAPERRERDCPWCAEPILTRARVCKHCQRDVDPSE